MTPASPPAGIPLAAVRVRVPASSANLGPGFDAIGLALDLHDHVLLRRLATDEPAPQIAVTGVAGGRLRPDENLLAYRGVAAVYEKLARPLPPLSLALETHLPPSRGFGGSAAAIVGGIVAANALEGSLLSQAELLALAAELEGHPDNVAPALLGGLVICVRGRDGLIAKRLAPPPGLAAVLCVPEHAMPTKTARDLLPVSVSHADAVFNLGRAALLVAAFQTADWGLLPEAMDDRLHQPMRGAIFPALYPTIEAALAAGAHGAALSGAGSAIIAFATGRRREIAVAMRRAAQAHGFPSQTTILRLASAGATVY